MKEKADKLRDKVQQVFDSNALHDHQRNAAQKTFSALSGDVRAVVTQGERMSV